MLTKGYRLDICYIQEDDKIRILKDLAAGSTSFAEAATTIKEIKRLQPIRDGFVATMEVASWEEAKEKYPQHTTDQSFRQFIGQDMKNPSEAFKVWLLIALHGFLYENYILIPFTQCI